MAPGVRVHGASATDIEVTIDEQWRAVPIPNKCGMPILFKKASGTGGDDSKIKNNIIVRHMGEVETGLAPSDWQYGGSLGPAPPVLLARKDGLPFTAEDFWVLDEYISTWGEVAEENEDCDEPWRTASDIVLQPEAFREFVLTRTDQPLAFLCVRFPLGSTVVAEGLSAPELNGKQGEVAQFTKERVGVRYPGREPVALKPDKLRLIQLAAPGEAPKLPSASEKESRNKCLERQEAMAITNRFVDCMVQDTFPERGELHYFGVGADYIARAQDVLAVWQGGVKHLEIEAEEIAEPLLARTMQQYFEKLCYRLAETRTPNSTYAKNLIENKFAAVEWDDM